MLNPHRCLFASKTFWDIFLIVVLALLILPQSLYENILIDARPHPKNNRGLKRQLKEKFSRKFHFTSPFLSAKEGDVLTFQNFRTDNIKSPDISENELLKLIAPSGHVTISASPSQRWRGGGNRKLRLFCRSGIGFHLEIEKDGKVVGRHNPSKYSLLQVFSVDFGVVGIRGVESQRYLCMDKKGRVTGKKQFGPACQFKETVEMNNYNTYSSTTARRRRKNLYLALTKRGVPKKGKKIPRSPMHKTAHWLPIMLNV